MLRLSQSVYRNDGDASINESSIALPDSPIEKKVLKSMFALCSSFVTQNLQTLSPREIVRFCLRPHVLVVLPGPELPHQRQEAGIAHSALLLWHSSQPNAHIPAHLPEDDQLPHPAPYASLLRLTSRCLRSPNSSKSRPLRSLTPRKRDVLQALLRPARRVEGVPGDHSPEGGEVRIVISRIC